MTPPELSPSAITIVGLGGSLRAGSHTRAALSLALRGAAEFGATTRLLDLNDFDLPFCSGKLGPEAPAGVQQLRAELRAAHGILLGTPEYHGSYSGVLKNALDLTGFEEFEGKIVGLVAVSGGIMGGLQALNDLQTVCRALHAWVLPELAAIPQAGRQFTPEGALKSPELEARLRTVGRQVARFAYLHSAEQALEFLRQWQQVVSNPGGGDHVEPISV